MGVLFQSPECALERVEKLRKEVLVPVQPSPQEGQAILEGPGTDEEGRQPGALGWLSIVAKHRYFFVHDIARFDSPCRPLFFQECFVGPRLACFLRVRAALVEREYAFPERFGERLIVEWQCWPQASLSSWMMGGRQGRPGSQTAGFHGMWSSWKVLGEK